MSLTERLAIRYPIIQAPMAGGGDTPELVAAVCNAGAFGFVGAAYLSPSEIEKTCRKVRTLTQRPFGINLFAPLPPASSVCEVSEAQRALAPFYQELGLADPELPTTEPASFDSQLEAALTSGAAAFSFAFGLLPSDAVSAVKGRGMLLMGTATTVDEAVLVERSGADVVIAQGSEAGGHRSTFATDFATGMIGTFALVPQVADAIGIPVVASGGIMDGRGIAAALALGASSVQMGTAFLTCHEAGVTEAYKQSILEAREDQTRVTAAFSGRPARGILNRFMQRMDESPGAILPFPVQNSLTRAMRREAAKQGLADYLSLWAGQGVRLARRQSAAELIKRLSEETRDAIRGLSEAGK